MTSLQTTLNGDGTISIIVPILKHPLYGISLDELDVLPKELGADEFCAAGQKDKSWEIRSISFEKPANEVRRIKKVAEVIAQFIIVERLKSDVELKYANLIADQQKREVELKVLRDKVKTPPAPPTEGVEYVANLPVASTIESKLQIEPDKVDAEGKEIINLTTAAYNRMLVEAFDRLSDTDKAAFNSNTQLIKATFSGYYLTTDGLKKSVVEFIV